MDISSCEVCGKNFKPSFNEKGQIEYDRVVAVISGSDTLKYRVICNDCYQNNWKFTEHGVLINETPVKKKGKK